MYLVLLTNVENTAFRPKRTHHLSTFDHWNNRPLSPGTTDWKQLDCASLVQGFHHCHPIEPKRHYSVRTLPNRVPTATVVTKKSTHESMGDALRGLDATDNRRNRDFRTATTISAPLTPRTAMQRERASICVSSEQTLNTDEQRRGTHRYFIQCSTPVTF